MQQRHQWNVEMLESTLDEIFTGCRHNIHTCVCSGWAVASSFPLRLSYLGSIRNTARSEGKHTQTNSHNLARRVYVGWSDNISLLHCLHRATLHLTNTSEVFSSNLHTALYFSFICDWEASATLSARLFIIARKVSSSFWFRGKCEEKKDFQSLGAQSL